MSFSKKNTEGTEDTEKSQGLARLCVSPCLCVLLFLCVLFRPGAAAAAVEDYLGKPVGSVRLLIEGRPTVDPVLTRVVETLAGRPLTMSEVRQTVTHLFSLARFEDVRVDAELENGRVALRYELSPIHPVSKIRFSGAEGKPGIDSDELRRSIVERYGGSPSLGRLSDMTRLLADLLRERGYLHASITPRADIEHEPERAVLVFTLDAGSRTVIGDVDIVGQPTVERGELLGRLGLRPGSPYLPVALSARIDRYVEQLRANRYYEAKAQAEVRLEDEDRRAHVTLSVTPGPKVTVTGLDLLSSDQRKDLVPVEREGSVDEDLLEDSTNRIEEFFRGQGYRDARAPHARVEENGELKVTFTINRGRLFRIAKYEITGTSSIPIAGFRAALRVRDGQPYSSSLLDADVSLIRDLYRRRGFASADVVRTVEPAPNPPDAGEAPVIARIAVAEGVPTIVDAVTFSGNEAIDQASLRARLGLFAGAPFVPGQLAVDRDTLQLAYQDLGYENATVNATTIFMENNTKVTIQFAIREGPQVLVDHVLIVGNVRTATSTIERELQVQPGKPFGLSAINESQRRLSGLGLFRRVRISELRHGDETGRDLLVTVDEAPPTTVGVGGGLEARMVPVVAPSGAATDELDLAPRAFFQIGRRNLFGRNRSANLFASLSLHSQHSTAAGVTEYRVVGTFREPRLFDTASDAFVNATVEQQVRSTFNFRRTSASAVIARHLRRGVSVTGNYQIQRTKIFDARVAAADLPLIDRTFTQFLLSSVSASLIRDTRDDPVDPASGAYISSNGQLAAEAIGSEVGFVKSFFTVQAFRTLPSPKRLVLAGNARLGMASGFTTLGQLPASERFFAGGDTTVRGFTLDRLGIRHVPFQPVDTLDSEGLPIGGNGLVIFNAELRSTVIKGWQAVGFLDSGNVFARTSEIDLAELRSAVGGGVRWNSPVGPIRFDLGFKVNRQQGEGLAAWFVSFGQAF
jgi:outer membrane protein insertion porin family